MPLRTPSTLRTSSPVLSRSRRVEMMGRPAPTVASRKTCPAPSLRWAARMACHSASPDEKPFLLGVTTDRPDSSAKGYSSVTAKSEVQSIRIVGVALAARWAIRALGLAAE